MTPPPPPPQVGELSVMWERHLQGKEGAREAGDGRKVLEEQLMTSRLREVEGLAELKELRLKVI